MVVIALTWANKLLQTYEACSSKVGDCSKEHILLPIGHLIQRAQIEVTIDEDSNFMNAVAVDLEDANTILPVSEDSASRTSGISPHPLHDKLVYVAGDYGSYVDMKKREYHETYMKNLSLWASSSSSHPTVEIIYKYLLKDSLISDLIKYGVLSEIDGKLDKKVKFQKLIAQTDAFVRFKVYSDDSNIEVPWKDKSLFESYIEYYRHLHAEDKELCSITGEMMYCTDKHPSKIRFSSDKAKLISANDASSFTFRGRIADKDNAVSIGYETSQKIHNALRWLIQEQAYQKNGLTVLIWNTENKAVLNKGLFYREVKDEEAETNKLYALNMNKAIMGFKENVEPRDDIMIMMLESATEGRLSVTCYQELKASQYYENIQRWYDDCKWMQYRTVREFATPYIDEIISNVYGTYRGETMVVDKNVDVRQKKIILPSILFGKNIPKGLIQQAYMQALHLSTLNMLQYQKCVGVLCALMRKESIEKKRQNNGKGAIWSMDLKENKENGLQSTAYLIGRLMAIYHEIEQFSLNIAKENRETNAMKSLVQCRKHPWRTLTVMNDKVQPYVNKLKEKACCFEEIKEDILEELSKREDCKTIRNLDYDFVMGYECQRLSCNKNNSVNKSDEMEEQEND